MKEATDKLYADWKHLERSERKFPRSLAGEEISGIDMVMLDADSVGCITTYFGRFGTVRQLDSERTHILQQCSKELEMVIPQLEGEARTYFEELYDITKRILREHAKTHES